MHLIQISPVALGFMSSRAVQDGLADRIAEYRLLAIVTLLLSIKEIVVSPRAASSEGGAHSDVENEEGN